MSYFLRRIDGNIWHGKFSSFPDDLVTHAVSTRLGGYSEAPFNGLNLGLHVGDSEENVLANRKKFIATLGFELEDIVTPNQVHGDKIFRVTLFKNYQYHAYADEYCDEHERNDRLISPSRRADILFFFDKCCTARAVKYKKRCFSVAKTRNADKRIKNLLRRAVIVYAADGV